MWIRLLPHQASPDATVTYYVNGAKSNAIADDAAIAVGAIVDPY